MAASPSSSPSTWLWQHDVFLCYRTKDTFDNFVCHLQAALRRAGLDFFSEENFNRGEDKASAISGAIERSKIAVVIFSKGFADSQFCLNNLVKILECREFLRQMVIPIFYDVDSFDVRTQRGRCYWRAFDRHEYCLPEDSEKLKIWRRALAVFGHFPGLSMRGTRHDAELVDLVVKEIGKQLKQASSIGLKTTHKYDVFLSFRGPDTRCGFTRHLDDAFRREGIRTFIDDGIDDGIMKGELIEQSILTAIEESKTAVIIFSENYASSEYCLDELVKIIQCRKLLGQVVIPVFYDVPTSVVSDLTGSFGAAFTKHEKVYEEEFERVYLWRLALKSVTGICGWDEHAMSEPESQLVKIVRSVQQQLKKTPSTNAEGMEELPVTHQAPTWLPDKAMTESTQIHGKRSRPTSSEGELPSASPFDRPPGSSSSSGIKALVQLCNKLMKTAEELIKTVELSGLEFKLAKVEQGKAKQMERLEYVQGIDDQMERPAEDLGESIEGIGGLCEVKSSAGGA